MEVYINSEIFSKRRIGNVSLSQNLSGCANLFSNKMQLRGPNHEVVGSTDAT